MERRWVHPNTLEAKATEPFFAFRSFCILNFLLDARMPANRLRNKGTGMFIPLVSSFTQYNLPIEHASAPTVTHFHVRLSHGATEQTSQQAPSFGSSVEVLIVCGHAIAGAPIPMILRTQIRLWFRLNQLC